MLTGWKADYILSLPTKLFFKLHGSLNKIEYRNRYWMLRELCYVAWIGEDASGSTYMKKMAEGYTNKLNEDQIVVRPKKGMSLEDPHTINVLASIFNAKKRTMGLA